MQENANGQLAEGQQSVAPKGTNTLTQQQAPKRFYSIEGKDGVYTVTPATNCTGGGGTKQNNKKKENPKKTTEKVRVRSKNDQGKEKEVERVVYVGPRGGKYIKNKDGSFSLLRATKKT